MNDGNGYYRFHKFEREKFGDLPAICQTHQRYLLPMLPLYIVHNFECPITSLLCSGALIKISTIDYYHKTSQTLNMIIQRFPPATIIIIGIKISFVQKKFTS